MNNFYDPYGFNKQTAFLLRGLGASDLIPTCRKRNISTEVLHELSVEEFIMLGANPKNAAELQSALNVKKRKSGIVLTKLEDRFQHFLDIIKHGEHQISLIQAFVAYCRLRLVKERHNIFIDPNKGLSASKALPISVRATLSEVEDAKKNLSDLEELISGLKVKPKHKNIHRICALISGLGIVTLVLFKICLT